MYRLTITEVVTERPLYGEQVLDTSRVVHQLETMDLKVMAAFLRGVADTYDPPKTFQNLFETRERGVV